MLIGGDSTRVHTPPALENSAKAEPGRPAPSAPRPLKLIDATIWAVIPLAVSSGVISCIALQVTWKLSQPLPSTLLARGGCRRMSERNAEHRVTLAAQAAGLGDLRITVHSGRRGFATYARLSGADALSIKRHGGWADTSKAADRYIDEADRERLNPLLGLNI